MRRGTFTLGKQGNVAEAKLASWETKSVSQRVRKRFCFLPNLGFGIGGIASSFAHPRNNVVCPLFRCTHCAAYSNLHRS